MNIYSWLLIALFLFAIGYFIVNNFKELFIKADKIDIEIKY